MKKIYAYLTLAMTSVLAAGLSSCSETKEEDNEFDNWQSRNETYFDAKYNLAKQLADAGNTDWKVLRSYSLNSEVAKHSYDHVVVEVKNEGKGSGCPFFTDSVKVHYSGRLIPTTSYPKGLLFDQSWTGDYNLSTMNPSTFAVSGVVNGFATALQSMHIGDRWTVTIPQQLGYASSSKSNIPAYSTLIFDITLVGYCRAASPAQAPAANGAKAVSKAEWIYE